MTRRPTPLVILLIAACLLLGPVCLESACAGECAHFETTMRSRRPDVALGLLTHAAPAVSQGTPADGRFRLCPVERTAVAAGVPVSPQRAGGLPLLI